LLAVLLFSIPPFRHSFAGFLAELAAETTAVVVRRLLKLQKETQSEVNHD
jgi:hypothetical protein